MKTRTVLIIDDSNIDRFMICEYLKSVQTCNYEFFEASSAEMGLQLLDEIIPDCILLDNIMVGHDMDGVDALPFIKKTRNKFTPIIMVTGSPTEEIEKKALDGGVVFYLDKINLDPDVLHEHIDISIERNTELRAMTA
jgi:CheY-like chemotaxis protein